MKTNIYTTYRLIKEAAIADRGITYDATEGGRSYGPSEMQLQKDLETIKEYIKSLDPESKPTGIIPEGTTWLGQKLPPDLDKIRKLHNKLAPFDYPSTIWLRPKLGLPRSCNINRNIIAAPGLRPQDLIHELGHNATRFFSPELIQYLSGTNKNKGNLYEERSVFDFEFPSTVNELGYAFLNPDEDDDIAYQYNIYPQIGRYAFWGERPVGTNTFGYNSSTEDKTEKHTGIYYKPSYLFPEWTIPSKSKWWIKPSKRQAKDLPDLPELQGDYSYSLTVKDPVERYLNAAMVLPPHLLAYIRRGINTDGTPLSINQAISEQRNPATAATYKSLEEKIKKRLKNWKTNMNPKYWDVMKAYLTTPELKDPSGGNTLTIGQMKRMLEALDEADKLYKIESSEKYQKPDYSKLKSIEQADKYNTRNS